MSTFGLIHGGDPQNTLDWIRKQEVSCYWLCRVVLQRVLPPNAAGMVHKGLQAGTRTWQGISLEQVRRGPGQRPLCTRVYRPDSLFGRT
jgi:hypothetical protein